MCRLLGVVSNEETAFRFALHDAPRSLSRLSHEHPDGWGLAVHARARGWELHRYAAHAGSDARFSSLAATSRGEMLVAHIRKKTVGPTRVENTHPFRRGQWIFAHNGTVGDQAGILAKTSSARAREVEGDTDSERLFAYLLTAVDETDRSRDAIEDALSTAARAATAMPGIGAINFLLGDGEVLYAFRFGRSLFLLDRKRGDAVVSSRRSPDTDAELDTPWSVRRHAFLIASEAMTDEPFEELREGTLIAVRGGDSPSVDTLISPA